MKDSEEIIKRLIKIETIINKLGMITNQDRWVQLVQPEFEKYRWEDTNMSFLIDKMKDKIVVIYCREPISYIKYVDVNVDGLLSHYRKAVIHHESVYMAKVKDMTFFSMFVIPHRSLNLLNIQFSNIERISFEYKEVLRIFNIYDKKFIEWEREPNLKSDTT